MARRWLDLSRSALQQLLHFFINRYKKLQPTPLEVGALLMLVMFPVGVWLNQRSDVTSEYLTDYANGFFMLGLGLVLAYLYIDRFNERAQRQHYTEVNGALVEAVSSAVNGLAIYSFGMLLKVPKDVLVGSGSDLIMSYIKFFDKYFDADRLEGLEHFKRAFDAALLEKLQELEHIEQMGAPHVIFTDQQAAEIVAACQPQVERMKAGMTRLVSARLKTRVIEDLLIFENEITGPFDTFAGYQAMFNDEILSAGRSKMSFVMWAHLRFLFEHALLFVFVLDSLLEGTAYRERQRRSEHGHWTTTASERKME